MFDVCALLISIVGQPYAMVEFSLRGAWLCDIESWPCISKHQPEDLKMISNHKPERTYESLTRPCTLGMSLKIIECMIVYDSFMCPTARGQ